MQKHREQGDIVRAMSLVCVYEEIGRLRSMYRICETICTISGNKLTSFFTTDSKV
jgi:hypothetical protein